MSEPIEPKDQPRRGPGRPPLSAAKGRVSDAERQQQSRERREYRRQAALHNIVKSLEAALQRLDQGDRLSARERIQVAICDVTQLMTSKGAGKAKGEPAER